MARYRCPRCLKVLERDPEDPLFNGRSYCSSTFYIVDLERLDDGQE